MFVEPEIEINIIQSERICKIFKMGRLLLDWESQLFI